MTGIENVASVAASMGRIRSGPGHVAALCLLIVRLPRRTYACGMKTRLAFGMSTAMSFR